ncbi:MAG: hypothetical protein HYS27_10390 [Deltaproteobacteria bacterium]|nr:hypothetical protein [Deltaproteobacteria bacterium]
MARVIKAGGQGGQRPARAPARIADQSGKKVIERAVYQAKQDAAHILKRADEARAKLLADGKKKASQAHEEAMARGASEAFAAAAAEALSAFRRRAERYAEAADDIRVLALEVVKKLLGTDPDLGQRDVERILQRGMAQLRARRRLRVQVSQRRLDALATERPNLMKAVAGEPDLMMEPTDDVGLGFARVVTEIGGALCAEETALDALALSVNVHEQPRAAGTTTDKITRASHTSVRSNVPDALVEDVEEEEDDTMQMVARHKTASSVDGDELEEVAADDDDDPSTHAARPGARRDRVKTGQVVVPARPATRVVPIAADADDSSEDDADLELFTDDAVGRTRRKR